MLHAVCQQNPERNDAAEWTQPQLAALCAKLTGKPCTRSLAAVTLRNTLLPKGLVASRTIGRQLVIWEPTAEARVRSLARVERAQALRERPDTRRRRAGPPPCRTARAARFCGARGGAEGAEKPESVCGDAARSLRMRALRPAARAALPTVRHGWCCRQDSAAAARADEAVCNRGIRASSAAATAQRIFLGNTVAAFVFASYPGNLTKAVGAALQLL